MASLIEITIWLQKPGDPSPRCGRLEVDADLLALLPGSEAEVIARETIPFLEAMLQLDPSDG